VRRTFEPHRLAPDLLAQAYAHVVPPRFRILRTQMDLREEREEGSAPPAERRTA
jgi:hypothetical protein